MLLFDQELIPGLRIRDELVDAAEEAELIAHIATLHLTPFPFQGFTGKRLTTNFGLAFDFETSRVIHAEPIPGWLDTLRRRAADFAEIPGEELVQALLIRYDPGAGIGWHRDRPQFDQVVGISLGAPATLAFRQRTSTGFRRVKLPLAPRSAYHLAGEARVAWEHGISAHDALRFSITFRSLRAHVDASVTQPKA
jgi:alkylated DNA repair dioxygenase AlkB